MDLIRGRVWKFGDNINTDVMAPGFAYNIPWEKYKEMILHVHQAFTQGVKPGDIIVAGKNWGCGSSRETAPSNLKKLGISCVIAESFGRIYFRNSIAIGLPSIVCPGILNEVYEGDIIELVLKDSIVRNITNKKELKCEPFSDLLLMILNKGGIIPYLVTKK